MEVRLKGQGAPVELADVERDDDVAVIGTTATGKRFVAQRQQIGEPIPPRHPYRIYLSTVVLKVVDPAFEEFEDWLLAAESTDNLKREVTTAEGHAYSVFRSEVRSILSATPADQTSAEAAANGYQEIEAEAEVEDIEIE
jgi:hypothetical protein